jgi:hypothetical protein
MLKPWYHSKTVWVNLIACAGLIVQTQYGFVVTPELQALAMTGINLLLRAVTKEEITW